MSKQTHRSQSNPQCQYGIYSFISFEIKGISASSPFLVTFGKFFVNLLANKCTHDYYRHFSIGLQRSASDRGRTVGTVHRRDRRNNTPAAPCPTDDAVFSTKSRFVLGKSQHPKSGTLRFQRSSHHNAVSTKDEASFGPVGRRRPSPFLYHRPRFARLNQADGRPKRNHSRERDRYSLGVQPNSRSNDPRMVCGLGKPASRTIRLMGMSVLVSRSHATSNRTRVT